MLAVIPLVAMTETLAGVLFGILLGTVLFPIFGTFVGLMLGGGAGGLTGWVTGAVCAIVLAPYFAVWSGSVRDAGRRRGIFALGAAALCAVTAPALLIADWTMQPYFPHYEELLPLRLAFAWLRQYDPAPADPDDPPPPEDPAGGAIIETFLLLFASFGAAVAGAIAARIATISPSPSGSRPGE